MDFRRILESELDFERRIEQSRNLSLFRRNPSTWELLLYLAQFEDGCTDGIYQTVGKVRTRYLGVSALLKFIRERRDDGLIIFSEQQKRSRRTLRLAPDLREEVKQLMLHSGPACRGGGENTLDAAPLSDKKPAHP